MPNTKYQIRVTTHDPRSTSHETRVTNHDSRTTNRTNKPNFAATQMTVTFGKTRSYEQITMTSPNNKQTQSNPISSIAIAVAALTVIIGTLVWMVFVAGMRRTPASCCQKRPCQRNRNLVLRSTRNGKSKEKRQVLLCPVLCG